MVPAKRVQFNYKGLMYLLRWKPIPKMDFFSQSFAISFCQVLLCYAFLFEQSFELRFVAKACLPIILSGMSLFSIDVTPPPTDEGDLWPPLKPVTLSSQPFFVMSQEVPVITWWRSQSAESRKLSMKISPGAT